MNKNLLDKAPFFLACKEARVESPTSLYSSFSLGPFHSRQSLTIANALRRTLLSELIGTAIISVQIDGVLHEYSMLKGVRESVLDIILNLKEVVLKVQFDSRETSQKLSKFTVQKPQIGYLKVRGPGIVRARDLRLPISIQCVNPTQYLFTLCEDGIIDLKVQIYQGKNSILGSGSLGLKKLNLDKPFPSSTRFLSYPSVSHPSVKHSLNSIIKNNSLPSSIFPLTPQSLTLSKEKEKPWKKSLPNRIFKQPRKNFLKKRDSQNTQNIIAIDSIFSPINQVNYIIEEKTSCNHIVILEIWTNGSIYPKDALFYAIHELMKLFSRLEMFKILDTTLLEKISRVSQFEKKINLGSKYLLPKKHVTAKVSATDFPHLLKPTPKFRKRENCNNFILRSINSNPFLQLLQFSRFLTTTVSTTFVHANKQQVKPPIQKANRREPEKMLINQKDRIKTVRTNNVLEQKNQIDLSIKSLNSIPGAPAHNTGKEFQRRKKSTKTLKKISKSKFDDLLFVDIGTLDMSLRAYTCLKRASICTIGELVTYTVQDLLSLKNFGKRSLEEVEKSLNKLHCSLKK